MIARFRTWSISRRLATLAIIVVVGVVGAFTSTLLAATKPLLADFGFGVAILACVALVWLVGEWYSYPVPPR